ncbi:MAG TPA: hypothetical protein VLC98_04630 [Phnomibacter sp.]|nr:hypothetical protein [Phnomibacter sp.]
MKGLITLLLSFCFLLFGGDSHVITKCVAQGNSSSQLANATRQVLQQIEQSAPNSVFELPSPFEFPAGLQAEETDVEESVCNSSRKFIELYSFVAAFYLQQYVPVEHQMHALSPHVKSATGSTSTYILQRSIRV